MITNAGLVCFYPVYRCIGYALCAYRTAGLPYSCVVVRCVRNTSTAPPQLQLMTHASNWACTNVDWG